MRFNDFSNGLSPTGSTTKLIFDRGVMVAPVDEFWLRLGQSIGFREERVGIEKSSFFGERGGKRRRDEVRVFMNGFEII